MAGKKNKAKSASSTTETPSSEPPKVAEESVEESVEESSAEPATEAKEEAEPSEPQPWYADRTLLLGLVAPMIYAIYAMTRVKQFTVDDSYISFRYARNWARGLGLVYNEGERIEGYTNFLWTIILGVGIKV